MSSETKDIDAALAEIFADPASSIPLADLMAPKDEIATPTVDNVEIVTEELDKSEKPATITTDIIKNDTDIFLESLPNDRERAAAKRAMDANWDPKKYENGGFDYREWNARTPLIDNLKAQQEQINKLKAIAESGAKNARMDLNYTKKQAEELAKQAEQRLVEAKDNRDIDTMETAYQQMTQAKQIVSEADSRLENLPKDDITAPTVSQEYLHALHQSGRDFIYRNKDWWFEESPNFSAEKVAKARELELKFREKDPYIDPFLLHTKIEVVLNKETDSLKKASSKETDKPNRAVRNPAIENVSSVNSSEYASKDAINEGEKLILQALHELERESPGTAARTISVTNFKKMRGIK